MATTHEPILSLSTVVKRPTIEIDGTAYELRTRDELPWLVYRGYADTFKRAGELLQVLNRTDEQEEELNRLLPPLTEALVQAPKKVLAKLNNDQRFAVLTVFSQLLLATTTKTAGATARQGRTRRKGDGRSSTKTTVN